MKFIRMCFSRGGSRGKPTVPGAQLSLSRSNDTVAIASAPGASPIGVDIEQVPTDVFSGFDDYVLGPTQTLTESRDPVRQRIDLWGCKEAAVKTTVHGLSVPPSDIEVMDLPSGIGPHGRWPATIAAPGYSELDPGEVGVSCSILSLPEFRCSWSRVTPYQVIGDSTHSLTSRPWG